MNIIKTITVFATSAVLLSACHSGKKMSYIRKFHRDAKSEVGMARISLKNDTVRVVYPEVSMFDFNKDEIKPAAKTSLERFATVLSKYDRINMIVNGYTDNVGTDAVNMDLSQRRANNAKVLFEGNGVAGSRIQTNGMGSSNSVMPNVTEEGREANRRVEILLFERK